MSHVDELWTHLINYNLNFVKSRSITPWVVLDRIVVAVQMVVMVLAVQMVLPRACCVPVIMAVGRWRQWLRGESHACLSIPVWEHAATASLGTSSGSTGSSHRRKSVQHLDLEVLLLLRCGAYPHVVRCGAYPRGPWVARIPDDAAWGSGPRSVV